MSPVPHRPEADKIREMFSQVAPQYDRANNILSLGIHHLWRKKLVELSEVKSGMSVLDCATGTGDLALEFKRKVGPLGQVIGTDFCVDMMVSAPLKAKKKKQQVRFEIADVLHLPYDNQSFDACSISFGIRNVENPEKALQEMARVVKSNGHVMILEFGQVKWPILGSLYNFYSEKVLPKVGGWITKEKQAYEYLQKSSALFPCGEDFVNLMKKTNAFSEINFYPLTGGIAYIYKGRVR